MAQYDTPGLKHGVWSFTAGFQAHGDLLQGPIEL